MLDCSSVFLLAGGGKKRFSWIHPPYSDSGSPLIRTGTGPQATDNSAKDFWFHAFGVQSTITLGIPSVKLFSGRTWSYGEMHEALSSTEFHLTASTPYIRYSCPKLPVGTHIWYVYIYIHHTYIRHFGPK